MRYLPLNTALYDPPKKMKNTLAKPDPTESGCEDSGEVSYAIGIIRYEPDIFSISPSRSLRSPLICVVITFVAFFYSIFISFFWAGLPAYFSKHNAFSGTFLVLTSFTLVHCHPSSLTTGAYSFLKSEMGFNVYAVSCVHRHRTSCSKSHLRRLGNVQWIPYPRVLQQNKRRMWESNLCPSVSTG